MQLGEPFNSEIYHKMERSMSSTKSNITSKETSRKQLSLQKHRHIESTNKEPRYKLSVCSSSHLRKTKDTCQTRRPGNRIIFKQWKSWLLYILKMFRCLQLPNKHFATVLITIIMKQSIDSC